MSPKTWLLVGCAVVCAAWAGNAISGCTGDDPVAAQDSGGSPSDKDTSTPGNPNGKNPGETCTVPNDCKSGSCADGVCCESACSGKCEACNLPGKGGKCEPIPDGEDPANECPTAPLAQPDGGAVVEDDGGDAGVAINVPEAGVTTDDKPCAGKCNGKRACGYPDKTKTCGTTFCNTGSTQGRAACDGVGHCQLGLDVCDPYACPSGAASCKTTCTGPADCASTHFCDPSNTCKARLANGAVCTSVAQCQTGNCVDGVCCNDSCAGIGGSCVAAGKVGQCTCPACASGGACMLWYRDKDRDGFGDVNGTAANGNAIPGCVAGAAPTDGTADPFVKDHTDCDDTNANAKPGQTAYFTTSRANGSFDYNCSGTVEKELAEFVGGTCGYCESVRGVCAKDTTCDTAGRTAYHGCLTFPSPISGSICKSTSQSAFHSTVACGSTASYFTCGACTVVNTTPGSSAVSRTQGCH